MSYIMLLEGVKLSRRRNINCPAKVGIKLPILRLLHDKEIMFSIAFVCLSVSNIDKML